MLLSAIFGAKMIVGCALGGTFSHARPILAYLSALQERGHKVAFASVSENLSYMKNYTFDFLDLGPQPDNGKSHKEIIEREDLDLFVDLPYARKNIFDIHYNSSMLGFQRVLSNISVDFFICDVFAEACFDTAIKNNTEYAVASFALGLGGFYDYPYIPSAFMEETEQNWGFRQRFLKTWYILPKLIYFMLPSVRELDSKRSKFNVAPSKGPSDRFNNRLYILNTLPGFWNVEIPPNVIQIGPVFQNPFSKMDSSTKGWLDSQSRTGKKVAYVAFGSMAYLAASHLLKIFSGLKCAGYSVLFASKSFNASEFSSEDLVNVFHIKWAAQQDILHHSAVKLFVSHGGIESMHESIEAGVPLLIKPFYGDQTINAKKIKGAHIGEYILNKYNFQSNEICELSAKISNSTTYTTSMKKYQALLKLKVRNNVNLAADYIEYVMENGVDILTTKSQNMNVFAASNYDVILSGYILLFVAAMAFYKCAKWILKSKKKIKKE
eukprot:NODE_202_length_14999_cov_0.270067.p3 type:complete len:494 gc:universal NODE_202_length_14999_cov_0.270067:11519-13000(+)